MKNPFLLLVRVQLMAYLGLGRKRAARDPKARRRATAMAVLYIVLVPILCSYMAGTAVALAFLGLGAYIPAFFCVVAGVVIFFTYF
jgi:hypothetical protein